MKQPLWESWLLLGVGALSAGIANILLKKSRLVATDSYLWFIPALFCYCLDLLLFAKALDRLEIAIAQPVSSAIVFSSIVIFSNIFLAERLTFNHLTALSFIFTGIVIMSQK